MTDAQPTPPLAVTVVEDELLAQDVLIRAARSWHYQCQAASTAEQALQLLENNLTPVVVTDLRMPGRGGLWLVQEVRRRWPQVGIIVLTAGHDPDAANECLRAGVQHYFFKPIKLDEFRHVLEMTWRTCCEDMQKLLLRRQLEQTIRRQTRRVCHTFLSAITSLARALEERDRYTAGHSRRVRYYADRLASAIGLGRKQRRMLSLAAQLHDLGKVSIPDAILHKPGRLTPEEYKIVQQHPVISQRILAPVVRHRAVLAAIRGHHERLDGTGYPDGLRGQQVPLLARLIAIPDCFDALTTSRAYRAAMPISQAVRILEDGAGSHFDADLVRTFIRLVPAMPLDQPRAGVLARGA